MGVSIIMGSLVRSPNYILFDSSPVFFLGSGVLCEWVPGRRMVSVAMELVGAHSP